MSIGVDRAPNDPTAESRAGDRLRVLAVCDWFVRYTAGLAFGLADQGCALTLLTRAHDLEFGGLHGPVPAGTARRFVAETLDGRGRHMELRGRASDPRTLREVARLRRQIAAWDPSVVHLQDSAGNDPRLLWLAGVRPGRYAVTIHDPTPHPGDPLPARRQRAVRWALLRAAGVVFVHSEALRDQLIDATGVRAPVVVVPHGTGEVAATPVPEAPIALFFGRVSHYKGIDVLAEALGALWSAVPEARVIIAGAGPLPTHGALEDSRVELVNRHVDDAELPALFARARCVVLPYRQASQSGVGSQAKVFGRAIVTTAVGGLPELVSDGSGVAVAPEDPAALAGALAEVLAAPGLAERMGERAAAGGHAADWPQIAHLTLQAYRAHLGTAATSTLPSKRTPT
jgi:glycosyltransferase involved in cell wall biosynthesis